MPQIPPSPLEHSHHSVCMHWTICSLSWLQALAAAWNIMWERNPRARQIVAAGNEHYSQEKVQNVEVQKYTDDLREQKNYSFSQISFSDWCYSSHFSCSSTFCKCFTCLNEMLRKLFWVYIYTHTYAVYIYLKRIYYLTRIFLLFFLRASGFRQGIMEQQHPCLVLPGSDCPQGSWVC